jgi:hypothetical protein
MAGPAIAHSFNDDLLANAGDLERARLHYPRIVHVLDHPELRAVFKSYDDPANAAKRRSRRTGLLAILCVALSLILLATELALPQAPEGRPDNLADLRHGLAIASAALAVVGAGIGTFGLLFAAAKTEWLHRRLMTERLRQFHFQTLICRLPEIAASLNDEAAATQYVDQRKVWFSQFRGHYERRLRSEFGRILDEHERENFWVLPHAPPHLGGAVDAVPEEVFNAYRDLRIIHQLQYATYKLGESETFLPTLPRSQAALFSFVSLLCILAIFLIHVAIGVSIPLHWPHTIVAWLGTVALWLAIAALAVRALEEGLQPERETERYLHYRASVMRIRDHFDAASSAHEKLRIMEEMERLSYDEMCDFMHTHARARFVM